MVLRQICRGTLRDRAARKLAGDRYFQANNKKYVPEGVEGRVPYKGPLADTIYQMVGGLRSGTRFFGNKKRPLLWTAKE